MLHHKLGIEVEARCISLWKEPWAQRPARVTLLVDNGDQFAVVMDPSNGFWFLPGGGVEQNESIEEAATREAAEELGVSIRINQIIETFHVTLIARNTGEQLKIHPFIVVYATFVEGRFKAEYAPKRKIFFWKKSECDSLLRETKVPQEYQCMKPYFYISKEIVGEFFRH